MAVKSKCFPEAPLAVPTSTRRSLPSCPSHNPRRVRPVVPRRGCLLPFAQALAAGFSLRYFCSPLSMLPGGPTSKSPRPTVGPKPDLLCDFAPLRALVSSSVKWTFLPHQRPRLPSLQPSRTRWSAGPFCRTCWGQSHLWTRASWALGACSEEVACWATEGFLALLRSFLGESSQCGPVTAYLLCAVHVAWSFLCFRE